MGYRPVRKVYTLKFDAHEGLVVKATSVSTGAFLQIAQLADAAKVDVTQMRDLFSAFADQSLRSWNLEMPIFDKDTGEETGEWVPIPATLEGMLTQEFEFVFEIISAWMDVMTGVDTPLETPSSGGKQSPEVSLPMEALSDSRAS